MKKVFRHWFEINCWDQIKIWFSHTLFVFRINRLLICYSWILLMTSVVNSSTNQKPIITLSAQFLCGRGTADLRKRNANTLIFQGKTTVYFRVFLFSVLVNTLILLTWAQSLRLLWFINVYILLKLSVQLKQSKNMQNSAKNTIQKNIYSLIISQCLS